jgi:hypothetical protein
METTNVDLQLNKEKDETWSTLVITLAVIAFVFFLFTVILATTLFATCCCCKSNQDYYQDNKNEDHGIAMVPVDDVGGGIPQLNVQNNSEVGSSWSLP